MWWPGAPFSYGREHHGIALFCVKKCTTDHDSILFEDHHQIRELHRTAKHNMRLKKRADYAREHLRQRTSEERRPH